MYMYKYVPALRGVEKGVSFLAARIEFMVIKSAVEI
jgi:hypothetical protein